jgi:putative cell wall-binding protein
MNFEDIDKALDIESKPVETEVVKKEKKSEIKKVHSQEEQIQKDYEYTRGNLYSIIEKGQEAIDGILELAQESDSPRAYEVAGQLIKSVADSTDKLMDLQKKLKDVNKEEKGVTPTNVTNNAVFLGSTAELQKYLKSSMKPDTK